jgi:hypothetical protein
MPAPANIASALAGLPNDLQRRPELNEFAMAIYAGIVPAGELSDEDQAMWQERAWQKALGQSEKRGVVLGGVQPVNGADTLLPPGVGGEALDAAIGDTLGGAVNPFIGTSMGAADIAPWAAAGLGGTSLPMMDGKVISRRLWDSGNITIKPVPSAGANAYAMFYTSASGASQPVTNGTSSIVYVFDPAKLIEASKASVAPTVRAPSPQRSAVSAPADPYGSAIMAPRITDGGQ